MFTLGPAGWSITAGYIDEVRILKGLCAYTAPFTPRAMPYLITD